MVEGHAPDPNGGSVTTTSIRWSTTIPASPTQRSSVTRRADLCGFPPSRRRGLRPRRHRAHRMTDNAKNYTLSAVFQSALTEVGAAHVLIRPHCPWQNGKVERLNRTLQVEWAYRRVYRSNGERTRALATWLRRYNTERPHSSLGGRPPISRLSRT